MEECKRVALLWRGSLPAAKPKASGEEVGEGAGSSVGPGLKGTHKVFADLALGHCVNIFQ